MKNTLSDFHEIILRYGGQEAMKRLLRFCNET